MSIAGIVIAYPTKKLCLVPEPWLSFPGNLNTSEIIFFLFNYSCFNMYLNTCSLPPHSAYLKETLMGSPLLLCHCQKCIFLRDGLYLHSQEVRLRELHQNESYRTSRLLQWSFSALAGSIFKICSFKVKEVIVIL